MFNNNLLQLWDLSTEHVKKEGLSGFEYQIDNDENVYYKYQHLNLDPRVYKVSEVIGMPRYSYELGAILDRGETELTADIEEENYWISNLTFRIDSLNNVYCFQYMSKFGSHSEEKAKLLVFNGQTLELVESSEIGPSAKFPWTVMSSTKKHENDKSVGLIDMMEGNFEVNNIILTNNGGYIVTEGQSIHYRVSHIASSSDGQSVDKRVSHIASSTDRVYTEINEYGNVYIFHFTKEGVLDWGKTITKNQSTLNYFGLATSYTKHINGNDLAIFFIKNAKNGPASSGQYSLLSHFISEKGEMQVDVLKKYDKTELLPRVKYAEQIDDCTLLIGAIKGNKRGVAIIKNNDNNCNGTSD